MSRFLLPACTAVYRRGPHPVSFFTPGREIGNGIIFQITHFKLIIMDQNIEKKPKLSFIAVVGIFILAMAVIIVLAKTVFGI
jgi:hypothetical protein